MREPTRYEKIIWWLKYRYHDFVRKSTGHVVDVMQNHPRPERLLPTQHLWFWARYEWEVGQTMNDGPDEYYLPWKAYWQTVKSGGFAECRVCSVRVPIRSTRKGICYDCMDAQPWLFWNPETGEEI